MTAPTLNFIITAFNRPNALRTCLSSLVQQTCPDWEAIVVDNSTSLPAQRQNMDLCGMDARIMYRVTVDQTAIADAIHKYSLYKATEIGVGLTNAPWLCFPNDDSYYCPWFAERMLHAAHANGWELVYCDFVAGGEKGHWTLEARPQLCCIDKTSFIVRRSKFHGFSLDPKDYAQADGLAVVDLVRRGVAHGRVPQVLVVHN